MYLSQGTLVPSAGKLLSKPYKSVVTTVVQCPGYTSVGSSARRLLSTAYVTSGQAAGRSGALVLTTWFSHGLRATWYTHRNYL